MSTTPNQKAMILDIWRELRERRGMDATIPDRVRWNWPSLSDGEVVEVLDAYQRRMKMKAVSSPKSPPKHHIRCELGPRKYTEVFGSTRAAKVFVDALLGRGKTKWESSDALTAKDGALRVQCDELEAIMDFDGGGDDWRMPVEMTRQLNAFLRGKWENAPGDAEAPRASKPGSAPRSSAKNAQKGLPGSSGKASKSADMVVLASICERRGWDRRAVRVAMRKAKWEKPGGEWAWSKDEAVGIEKKLEKLIG
jgi:hypothetical protein